MKELLKKMLIFLFILYEEIFLYPAKKLLKLVSKYINYEKWIFRISQNFFYSLIFIIILTLIAELAAVFAGILILKGIWLGFLLYFVKIVTFIPLIDLLKHNKKKLLKIKQIRIIYFYYLVLQRLPLIRNIRNKINFFKLSAIKYKNRIFAFLERSSLYK